MQPIINTAKNNYTQLSICIPTYNRLDCLENCLESIKIAKNNHDFNFEVCISDNNSKGNAKKIVDKYSKFFKIKYFVNNSNIGVGGNIFQSVEKAEGEYSWIIGNDDMMLPYTFKKLSEIFKLNKEVDFFYINSYSINSELILNNKKPIDFFNIEKLLTRPTTVNLFGIKLIEYYFVQPKISVFSKINESKKVDFFKLIDHKVSWDYMIGIFLSIFRTKYWHENKHNVDLSKISDQNYYTNKNNSFPHLIIFANAFKYSKAYIQHDPLSINLKGEREWVNLWPFFETIRIPQMLDLYRKNGMPLMEYVIQKNWTIL